MNADSVISFIGFCEDGVYDELGYISRSLLTTKKVYFMICHERVLCVVGIHLSPFLLWGPSSSGTVAGRIITKATQMREQVIVWTDI